MTDSPRRMFVLGHRGMLGHVVARYAAEAGYEVMTSDQRYSGAPDDALVEGVRTSGAAVVVNCLGLTKQRSDDREALYLANATFPVHLATRLHPAQYVLHASTDCVFSGVRGGYRIQDSRDATDAYGFSKVLGESIGRWPNATVLRVSVIGPDRGDGRGLLAWFLRQPAGRQIPGYTDHRWNGITSLEWAAVALECVAARGRGESVASVMQPGTTIVTKYDLLCAFRDVFAPHYAVTPVESTTPVDRSLVATDARPSIREQLERLSTWYPLGASPGA